jgi:outer membrane receptor for ferrienterochelin and colicins
MPSHFVRSLLLASAGLCASPALAQDPPAAAEPAEGAGAPQGEAPGQSGGRSYTPADFTRFAPRNAFDMLSQVPGFSIVAADTERRGLGEASGNVLINGERWAGKSTDILTELRRISASSVVRIDVVDGATLNVPGLAGQVANVVTARRGLTGNFTWRPQIRAHLTEPRWTNGEASLSGQVAGMDFSLSLSNDSFRNGNAGPEIVFTPAGAIIDRRDEELTVYGDQPRLSGTLRRNFGDGSILNLNGAFGLFHNTLDEISLRSGPGQPDRDRRLHEQEREYNYELGGDYELGLGGGRFKLIGLKRFEHSPFSQTLLQTYADNRPDDAQRFTQVADETETIGRGEYRWSGGGADWQVSAEGALNQLDIENALFSRNAQGEFVPIPFPNAAATVQEKRAEARITYGRPLSPELSLQASVAGEYSQISQDGAGGVTRAFVRPKGFLNLAWRPEAGLDLSARLEREVGQLNFFDFVASGNISSGTQNAGNANLVPPQSWNAQVQATRALGPWGTATARVYGRWITDIVDIIPIGATGQSPGNLDGTATVFGLQWTSTFNFDPLGWRGAKLDLDLQFQKSALDDPLTGERRPINENLQRRIAVNLRHDIPGSDWAYGGSYNQFRQSALLRLDQAWQFRAAPGLLGAYVENKDVMGLTVRASVDNLIGDNESFTRDFHDGRRPAPILFTEYRDRFSGPIFTLSVSGTI